VGNLQTFIKIKPFAHFATFASLRETKITFAHFANFASLRETKKQK
jgi:hypothetical protein